MSPKAELLSIELAKLPLGSLICRISWLCTQKVNSITELDTLR